MKITTTTKRLYENCHESAIACYRALSAVGKFDMSCLNELDINQAQTLDVSFLPRVVKNLLGEDEFPLSALINGNDVTDALYALIRHGTVNVRPIRAYMIWLLLQIKDAVVDPREMASVGIAMAYTHNSSPSIDKLNRAKKLADSIAVELERSYNALSDRQFKNDDLLGPVAYFLDQDEDDALKLISKRQHASSLIPYLLVPDAEVCGALEHCYSTIVQCFRHNASVSELSDFKLDAANMLRTVLDNFYDPTVTFMVLEPNLHKRCVAALA